MKNVLLSGILVALIVVISGCPLPEAQSTSTATGGITGQAKFVNAASHQGILITAEATSGLQTRSIASRMRGAAVAMAIAAQASTDSNGLYTLTGLPVGTYTVSASSKDSLEKAVTTSVTVVAGKDVTATDLNLTPTGQVAGSATLNGAVTGNLGIIVYVAGTSFAAMTDDGGSYVISSVPAGSGYVLVASMDGYDSALTTVTVAAGETITVAPMNLTPHVPPVTTGSVRGIVRLNGQASGNAGIIAYIAGTSNIRFTDDAGSFMIDGVSPGSHTLTATKEGYIPTSVSVNVTVSNTVDTGTLSLAPYVPVSTPTFTPGAGLYGSDQSVSIQCATNGATIYYATDGTDPTTASALFNASTPIVVSGSGTNRTIKAFAVKTGMPVSYIATATYSINYSVRPVGPYVYVVNRSALVMGYSTGPGGMLIPLTTPSVPAGASPMGITAVANGRFLYVTNSNDFTVSTYAVGAGGLLSPLGAPTPIGGTPWGIAATPNGSFLYVAGTISNEVSAFAIGFSGRLTPLSTPSFATDAFPIKIAVTPNGSYLYVVNFTGKKLSAFKIRDDGLLTPLSTPTYATGGDPNGIAVTPNGSFLYVTNSADNTVSAWAIGSGGLLTRLSTFTFATGRLPNGIAVTPDGSYLYVTNSGGGTVSAYAIGSGGLLTPLSTPTVATGFTPLEIAVTPSGSSLYVTNSDSNNVSAYSIGGGGLLTPLSTPTYAAGVQPFGIAIMP